MSRLVLLVISIVVGAVVAVGASFAAAGVLSSLHDTQSTQTLYNYGTR